MEVLEKIEMFVNIWRFGKNCKNVNVGSFEKKWNSWKYWKKLKKSKFLKILEKCKKKIFLKILKKWKNGRFGKTWKIVNVGDLRKNQIYVKIESFVKI